MSKVYESKEPPQALAQRTRLSWGRTPRTVVIEGVPILFVDADEMRRLKAQPARTVTMADLAGAKPLDHIDPIPEETP
jgi:hypothetical protein